MANAPNLPDYFDCVPAVQLVQAPTFSGGLCTMLACHAGKIGSPSSHDCAEGARERERQRQRERESEREREREREKER